MKKWKDYIKENEMLGSQEDPKTMIDNLINVLSHFQPKDVEDTKDLLLDLQRILDDKITGA